MRDRIVGEESLALCSPGRLLLFSISTIREKPAWDGIRGRKGTHRRGGGSDDRDHLVLCSRMEEFLRESPRIEWEGTAKSSVIAQIITVTLTLRFATHQ